MLLLANIFFLNFILLQQRPVHSCLYICFALVDKMVIIKLCLLEVLSLFVVIS